MLFTLTKDMVADLSREQAMGAMRDFLAQKSPGVLCVSGDWGTGKTFAWQQVIGETAAEFFGNGYAYVSLFGIQSIESLKTQIMSSAQIANDGSTLAGNIRTFERKLGRFAEPLRIFASADHSHILKVLDQLKFAALEEWTICIDDWDRKSDALDMKDVLGLVSFLTDARSCKICMLMHKGVFEEKDQNIFDRMRDKLVTRFVAFNPTAEENIEIALLSPSALGASHLRTICRLLEIRNIRTIRQISSFTNNFPAYIFESEPDVLYQALWSASIFIYFLLEKPPSWFAKITDMRNEYLSSPSEGMDQELFDFAKRIGFMCDDFDEVIHRAVAQGYFDSDQLVKLHAEAKGQHRRREIMRKLSDEWNKINVTLYVDREEFFTTISSTLIENPTDTPIDYATMLIKIYRDAGETDKVRNFIRDYVAAYPDKYFMSISAPDDGLGIDPELFQALKGRWQTYQVPIEPVEALRSLKAGQDRLASLAAVSELQTDDFVRIFRETTDVDNVVYGALASRRVSNPDAVEQQVLARAEEALRRLAGDDPFRQAINRAIFNVLPAP